MAGGRPDIEMANPVLALFCMPEDGHFRQLRPLIADLARMGFAVHVFTHRRFGPEVERLGGIPIDLFGKYPLKGADAESIPVPCRYVSFAAVYAEEILEELKQIGPALVLYETFSVIGRLAARLLGLPFINISTGHNLDPSRFLPMLRADARVALSESCHRAIDILRDRYGESDASPFSYISGLSPFLNICCEPPEFLTEQERKVFEPLAFYGCISPLESGRHDPGHAHFSGKDKLRIYMSFGTVSLKYYASAASGAFQAVSECLADMPEAQVLISLGGAHLEEELRCRLTRPNVEFVNYVDQWAVLKEADVFITHHGMNSTHEAIFRCVPMLSYPFFSDQPTLAQKCHEFGIAIPMGEGLRDMIGPEDVRTALRHVLDDREQLSTSLRCARDWELETIANRPFVLKMIKDLV